MHLWKNFNQLKRSKTKKKPAIKETGCCNLQRERHVGQLDPQTYSYGLLVKMGFLSDLLSLFVIVWSLRLD